MCVCMYACMYVCMFVCVYVCLYVCVYRGPAHNCSTCYTPASTQYGRREPGEPNKNKKPGIMVLCEIMRNVDFYKTVAQGRHMVQSHQAFIPFD